MELDYFVLRRGGFTAGYACPCGDDLQELRIKMSVVPHTLVTS